MKKQILIIGMTFVFATHLLAKADPRDSFADPEANFKFVMEKLMREYIDKNLSKEDLYRAATAGMVSSLNKNEETWNKLLSPQEFADIQGDLSGKVTGIGAGLKFDSESGYGQVIGVIPNSPAEKVDMKIGDQILSVDGQKFKGKQLNDLVVAVRGDVGKTVHLKVLRDDRILDLKLKRQVVPWTPVKLEYIDDSVAVLTIGFFNEQTPKLVEEALEKVNKQNVRKLIVDVRDNSGGGFDQAVQVAELFLPKSTIVTNIKNRDGSREKVLSKKSVLKPEIPVTVITNKGTYCGAELFVAALRDNKSIKIVGDTTFGKWNAQGVEVLPNKFAVKYTVKEFLSPLGQSYHGVGIKPDLEVSLPKGLDVKEMQSKFDISKRLNIDLQLKAALELVKVNFRLKTESQ